MAVAAIITAVVATGATVYAADKAATASKRQADAVKQAAQKQEAQFNKTQEEIKRNKEQAAMKQLARRKTATGTSGRRDIHSSLGTSGSGGQTANKTLLGA